MTTLLVAAAGGHLQQLHALRDRLRPIDPDVVWATFDTPQSRSLLAEEDVVWARYPTPRDVRRNVANVALANEVLRTGRFDRLVSTGSSIAVSFFVVARARGVPCHYIESATRLDGPSLSGRIVQRIPGVHLYTQHPRWATGRWQHRGSVFDGYEARRCPARPLRRIVMTTGSARDFGFRRLVDRLVTVVPDGVEVLWQTGSTDVLGLPIEARPTLPADELRAAIEAADVVVSHAGIGSSLVALEAGLRPVLVPRTAALGEHIDDHQHEIAAELAELGLAAVHDADDLSLEHLVAATSWTISPRADLRPYHLDRGSSRKSRQDR